MKRQDDGGHEKKLSWCKYATSEAVLLSICEGIGFPVNLEWTFLEIAA